MLFLQRSLQQSQVMGGQTTVRRAVSGTASSVAFTPLQGLEIVSPQAVEKKVEDAKYFSSTAGFLKVKKQWLKVTGPDDQMVTKLTWTLLLFSLRNLNAVLSFTENNVVFFVHLPSKHSPLWSFHIKWDSADMAQASGAHNVNSSFGCLWYQISFKIIFWHTQKTQHYIEWVQQMNSGKPFLTSLWKTAVF